MKRLRLIHGRRWSLIMTSTLEGRHMVDNVVGYYCTGFGARRALKFYNNFTYRGDFITHTYWIRENHL